MVLIRDKPQAQDILSDSQVDLLNNNNAIDDSFATDHVAASNTGPNNGLHNMVTTVTQGSHPTTTNYPIFYAVQDHAKLGPLQYTKGPSNHIQSPLTRLQSDSAAISQAANTPLAILNFAGIPYCFGTVMATGAIPGFPLSITIAAFFWNGANGNTNNYAGVSFFPFNFSGSTLNLTPNGNPASNLAWTLEFQRILTPT